MVSSLPAALVLFLFGIFGAVAVPQVENQSGMIFVLAWTSLLVGLVLVPAFAAALFRLRNQEMPALTSRLETSRPACRRDRLGHLPACGGPQQPGQWFGLLGSHFVLPFVLLPIIALVAFGARKLTSGSALRTWGNITFSFSVTMPFILLLELVFVLVILVFVGVWVSSNPALLNQLMAMQEQLTDGLIDPAELERMVFEFLQNPWVLNSALLVIALLIPLMEELFKPMALWFLAGKKLTPSQGFVGGLIAGACFALLETAGSIGIPTDLEWFTLLLGRTGTGLLHITLSGLVGWGLASLFYEKNWGRALGNYLFAVLMHGTWNLFALLSGIIPVLPDPQAMGNFPYFLSQAGPFVLFTLAIINFIILVRTNQKLRIARPINFPAGSQNQIKTVFLNNLRLGLAFFLTASFCRHKRTPFLIEKTRLFYLRLSLLEISKSRGILKTEILG